MKFIGLLYIFTFIVTAVCAIKTEGGSWTWVDELGIVAMTGNVVSGVLLAMWAL